MNDHQQVAAFILSKLNQAPMIGDEAEAVISAKKWLIMIQNGQFQVTEATPLSEKEDTDESGN